MDAEDGEQLRITFEDYRKISNMLILHMREFEEKNKGSFLEFYSVVIDFSNITSSQNMTIE